MTRGAIGAPSKSGLRLEPAPVIKTQVSSTMEWVGAVYDGAFVGAVKERYRFLDNSKLCLPVYQIETIYVLVRLIWKNIPAPLGTVVNPSRNTSSRISPTPDPVPESVSRDFDVPVGESFFDPSIDGRNVSTRIDPQEG